MKVFGEKIKRTEDPRFLRGDAKFIADIDFPGMLHMAILRSPHGHALVKRIDPSAALKLPGVVRVVTADDLGDMMPLPCVWVPGGVESHFPPHPMGLPGSNPVLSKDKVRYIGDAIAAVVAETRAQAHDALDAIHVDYELLPVVTTPKEAIEDGAPQLHEAVPNNLNAYWTCGDEDATDRAISEADVVVSQSMLNQRTINSPIEPRGAIGSYDPATEEYTLYASTQNTHNHRLLLAYEVLGVPFNKVRVISPDIGGSFGTKGYLYSDMALVMYLSKELGRPVKWVDTSEGLMRSTVQGRDQHIHGTLAGNRDGTITAMRCTSYANLGAYPSTVGPGVATAMMGRSITGCYAIAHAFCEVYAAFTNVVPLGAQRGSGRAEATFLVERLVDRFAAEIGMDPVEVRRKNFVQPEQFPFDNGLGWMYDSGNYPAALEKALEMADYANMAALKAGARRRGKRLGMGIGCFVAVSGVGPSPRMAKEGHAGWHLGELPTSGSTPPVTSRSRSARRPMGSRMRPSSRRSRPRSCRSTCPASRSCTATPGRPRSVRAATAAARSASAARRSTMPPPRSARRSSSWRRTCSRRTSRTSSMRTARPGSEARRTRARRWGRSRIAGWYGWDLPNGMEPNWDVTTFFDPPEFNFPYGAHVATVEIDERTGEIDLVNFVAVTDVGEVANPMVINGQVHGGITHGVGQALFERAIYDDQGHLMTANLTEYAIPRATDLPEFNIDRTVTPTQHNPLGAKGAGEIGAVGAAAAIGNAVVDALSDLGVKHVDMPYTPEKLWRILQENGHRSPARSNGGGA